MKDAFWDYSPLWALVAICLGLIGLMGYGLYQVSTAEKEQSIVCMNNGNQWVDGSCIYRNEAR